MKIGGNPPIWVSHQNICPPTELQKSVGAYDILSILNIAHLPINGQVNLEMGQVLMYITLEYL